MLASGFVAGVLVYLATRDPVAGAVLPAAGAGVGYVGTGLWVWRFDPFRTRARICLVFYLAAGCWRAAAAAVAAVIAFVVMANLFDRRPDLDRFSATMLVLIAGVALSTVLGLVATVAALVTRTRVWINPNLRALLEDGDPEDAGRRVGRNHAVAVVGTALVVPMIAACGAVLVAKTADGRPPAEFEGVASVVSTLLLVFGGLLAMIPLYAWVSARVLARTPRECWPPDGKSGGP